MKIFLELKLKIKSLVHKSLLSFILFFLFSSVSYSENLTVMSINAQNLFDTKDDPGKDDKAFLQ